MKGTLKIFTLLDTPIRIHWSFLFLMIFIGYYGWMMQFSQTAFLMFCALFACLFLCVILHELGHATMARYFNVKTRDIILLPIGGVARLERLPRKAVQELSIALAGPLVNGCIALFIWLICWSIDGELTRIFSRRGHLIWEWGKLLPLLFYINLSLLVLNLVPAFPLDGGRVFRALSSMLIGRKKGTRLSVLLAQVLAITAIGYGMYQEHAGALIVGMFLFFMSRNASSRFELEEVLLGASVMEVTDALEHILYYDEASEVLVGELMPNHNGFVVNQSTNILMGVLPPNSDLVNWEEQLMKTYPSVAPNQTILDVVELMRQDHLIEVPVLTNEGTILGIVSQKGIGDYIENV